MCKVMDIVFAEGNRLGIPVVLDTDAKSKCERDQHLGMELAAEVPFGDFGAMHHLIEYTVTFSPVPPAAGSPSRGGSCFSNS